MICAPIDTFCVAIKITRFDDSWDKKGMDIALDPFGGGVYNI